MLVSKINLKKLKKYYFNKLKIKSTLKNNYYHNIKHALHIQGALYQRWSMFSSLAIE
jgi:hypothetical protein